MTFPSRQLIACRTWHLSINNFLPPQTSLFYNAIMHSLWFILGFRNTKKVIREYYFNRSVYHAYYPAFGVLCVMDIIWVTALQKRRNNWWVMVMVMVVVVVVAGVVVMVCVYVVVVVVDGWGWEVGRRSEQRVLSLISEEVIFFHLI